MSSYTTEVRYIVEAQAKKDESAGFNSIDEMLTNTVIDGVFNFQFPIFDEDYRYVLLKKILRHYWTREICCETVGRWKLFLQSRLDEIMPYYNKLYESELLEFNPLWDVDMTTVGNRNSKDSVVMKNDSSSKANSISTQNGHSSSESDSKAKGNKLFSDTPQGGLSGVLSGSYLTNATVDEVENSGGSKASSSASGNNMYKDSSESSSNRMGNSTDAFFEKVSGVRQGEVSKRLLDFRQTFLNIDKMIIDELEDLFFSLW